MKTSITPSLLCGILPWLFPCTKQNQLKLFPSNQQQNVNPDTHLVLQFASPPTLGTSGKISVYDANNQQLVDMLDLAIPPSPNPTGRAPSANGSTTAPIPSINDTTIYQTNIIGGVDFHFFPIIIEGNTATIYLHNNKLQYSHRYFVNMDPEVLKHTGKGGSFKGFRSNYDWTFATKRDAPRRDRGIVVVSADGRSDFNTIQGAIDWAPVNPEKTTTVFIKNGNYTELVFGQNKTNIVLRGQNRGKTIVGYPNNSAFNPTLRGPSRRPAFSLQSVADVQLSDFTIKNYFIGQAEALLVRGNRVILDHMTLEGSGDAFTTYGTIYVADSKLRGDGDTVLGYAAIYWIRSEIESIGPVTWTRTPQGSHGNIFVNSTIIGLNKPLPWTITPTNPGGQKVAAVFARLPDNSNGAQSNFPYAEMVLINVKTENIAPVGWSPIAGHPFDTSNVHFWEYNTMDLQGNPTDLSQRNNVSKQLALPQDAKIIADYSNPEYVLNGWKPIVI